MAVGLLIRPTMTTTNRTSMALLAAAHDTTVRVLAGALAVWTGTLLVHGVYTLVTRARTPPSRRCSSRSRAAPS